MKNHQTRTHLCPLALLCIFFFTGTGARAQERSPKKDSTAKKESHWVFGATYQNNDVYLGRRDSVAIPYITPSIGYHDKSGFFVTGSASYLPASGENRFDVGTIEAGYSHTSDKFNAEVSAAKDFYSDQSFAVTSEIKGRLAASLSYDLGFIEPSIDLGAEFSDKADIGAGLGLGHSFTLIEDRFEVDPTVHVNAATQNFYGSYYSKRRYSAKRTGGNPKNIAASIANAAQFRIMDYELEAPFEYTIMKKLKLTFTPTLAIPVSPSTVTLVSKSTGNTANKQSSVENLSSVFYFSLGFSYTL